MTFIITFFCEEPTRALDGPVGPLYVEEAVQDEGAWARAGYLKGLEQRIGRRIHASAYHVVLDNGEGYRTSNAFFKYPDEGDDRVPLVVDDGHRSDFHAVLRRALEASAIGKVMMVLEYNGSVTMLDEAVETEVDVIGPLTVGEFWRLHDLDEICEDSIVLIES